MPSANRTSVLFARASDGFYRVYIFVGGALSHTRIYTCAPCMYIWMCGVREYRRTKAAVIIRVRGARFSADSTYAVGGAAVLRGGTTSFFFGDREGGY